jgi:hypothetical protein
MPCCPCLPSQRQLVGCIWRARAAGTPALYAPLSCTQASDTLAGAHDLGVAFVVLLQPAARHRHRNLLVHVDGRTKPHRQVDRVCAAATTPINLGARREGASHLQSSLHSQTQRWYAHSFSPAPRQATEPKACLSSTAPNGPQTATVSPAPLAVPQELLHLFFNEAIDWKQLMASITAFSAVTSQGAASTSISCFFLYATLPLPIT